MAKTLILSPHLDDEVLGCTSFLGPATFVLYFTSDHPITGAASGLESARICKSLDMAFERLNFPVNQLDSLGAGKLVSPIEAWVENLKPHTVLLPPLSYNQDHRAVYLAAQVALRPHDRNHFVKRVLVYEEPETIQTMGAVLFQPNYFQHLNIERKEQLYGMYASQVRGHRSVEHVRALATLRGSQANMQFAEAFHVLRWVE